MTMADFEVRGFRLDDPLSRTVLEGHARAFLAGFNLARRWWRLPHAALRDVPDDERGFAYEGAAMLAAMVDGLTVGRAGALETLLAGPGWRYRHLIHVGVGWAMHQWRLPSPRLWRLDPLLRWLALDGAGFSRTFFSRSTSAPPRQRAVTRARTAVLAQGSGRALWFVHAGSVPAIADHIASCPAALRPHLWAGVGLAATYAGPGVQAQALLSASGDASAHVQQGAVFAVTARLAAGPVPQYTSRALQELSGLDPHTAARWADETARDLVTPGQSVAGYLRWRQRLRARLRGEREQLVPPATRPTLRARSGAVG
jgi:enediyne biosynthesis protein E3